MTYIPDCKNHKPVQHRDAKPPWCEACGLTADYQVPTSRLDKEKTVTVQIKTTQTLQCPAGDLTAGMLASFIENLDADAKIRVRNLSADRPGEISMITIESETTTNQMVHKR